MEIPFASFGEFLDMGGYAFNVWSVYLLFLIFLLVNLVAPLQRRKRLLKELQRRAVLNESHTPVTKAPQFDSSKPVGDSQ